MTHCLYIHGFNSSGNSYKSTLLARYISERGLPITLHSPDLAVTPAEAIKQLQQLVETFTSQELALVGSSMGGFYATCLAEQFDLRALLVNPVVHPARLFRAFIGPQYNPYTDEHYELGEQHLKEVEAITPKTLIHPNNYLVLLGQKDETLDYKEAQHFYQQAGMQLIPDGDHQLFEFEQYLPEALDFLYPD